MERRDRVLVVSDLPLVVALLGVIGPSGPRRPRRRSFGFAAPDVLEPAKSALRLKQFADAAGRLAAARSRPIHARSTCSAQCTWHGLGVGEDAGTRAVAFTTAAAKGEPRAAYALAALSAHATPADDAAARLAWQKPRRRGTSMQRACCRQASCHCRWILVPSPPIPH